MEKSLNVEAIFNAALAMKSVGERAAYLDGACRTDANLRARVEALLAAHDEQGSFLLLPTEGTAADIEQPGTIIGRYKLLQSIGEGGFGAVYMAEQQEPVRRIVALKIIKLGMDTKQVVARFEAERQALALMDHPNIAKVLDAGATDSGRPYFVMELVRGIPITKYCDQNNLGTRERLKLFLDVCHAVQHAHQKGVIHRDIKPSNVMITLHDGRPVAKIIDFGISKATSQRLTEKTLFTEYHQFIGTPEYMSPEQAEMSGLDIDTRSDLYSLGVLLYELLTGTTPFDAKTLREAGYGEIQRIIREEDFPKPSTRVATLVERDTDVAKHRAADPAALSRLMRGDLDWIVMKAMEKDRTRRYSTASEFADDVHRFLNSEPVIAGPPSVSYKVKKFVQRHRLGVMAGATVVAALLVGSALATVGLVQANRERDVARAAQAQAGQDRDAAEAARARADEQAARSQAIADFLQDMLVSTDPTHAVGLDVDVESVVATAREVFGNDHATVAATLSSLAVQLQGAGNYVEAEPLQRESLRLWQQLYGNDNVNVGIAWSRLGTLLRQKGDDASAEEAFRKSLEITHELPDEGGVVAANTLLEFAEVLMNRGAYDQAEAKSRDSLRIRRHVAPHQRLQIAITFNMIANAMVLDGRSRDAGALLDETLTAFRDAFPPKSNLMAKVLVQVGLFQFEQQKLGEAEKLFREALRIYGDIDEPAVMYRDLAIQYLAGIVRRNDDKTPEYLSTWREFFDYVRTMIGRETLFGVLLADYANYMHDHDRPLEAITMATEALEILHKTGGEQRDTNAALKALRNALGRIACDTRRCEEDYQKSLAAAQRYLVEKPDDVAVGSTLGLLQYRLGMYEVALATCTSSAELALTQGASDTPVGIAVLAMAHHRLGHREEARAALIRLQQLMRDEKLSRNAQSQSLLREAEQLIHAADDREGDAP